MLLSMAAGTDHHEHTFETMTKGGEIKTGWGVKEKPVTSATSAATAVGNCRREAQQEQSAGEFSIRGAVVCVHVAYSREKIHINMTIKG